MRKFISKYAQMNPIIINLDRYDRFSILRIIEKSLFMILWLWTVAAASFCGVLFLQFILMIKGK